MPTPGSNQFSKSLAFSAATRQLTKLGHGKGNGTAKAVLASDYTFQ